MAFEDPLLSCLALADTFGVGLCDKVTGAEDASVKKSVERARADLEYAADCLTDFVRGYETVRAETGALLAAEFVLLVSGFLRPKG